MLSSEQIEIRLAVRSDRSSISSLLSESFMEYKSLYTAGGLAATTPTSEQIIDRMAEGPVWVALHKDQIVGTVSVIAKGEALYIRGMAVLPAARGQRIGALLLSHIEELAAANQHQRLFLSTTPFLTQAIRLYERFGFRRSDEGPHDLFGTPLFTMTKTLGP
jgi:GNAT superfamily N-acetyltransferase